MFTFKFLGNRVAVFFSLTRLAFLFNTKVTQATRIQPGTRQFWLYPFFVRVTYPMPSKRKDANHA